MDENILIISSDNDELDKDLKSNKDIYIDQVYNCFLKQIHKSKNIPSKIKVFKFANTELQVIIKSANFISNIENLLNYYIKQEDYEKCSILTKIKNRIMNTK